MDPHFLGPFGIEAELQQHLGISNVRDEDAALVGRDESQRAGASSKPLNCFGRRGTWCSLAPMTSLLAVGNLLPKNFERREIGAAHDGNSLRALDADNVIQAAEGEPVRMAA